MSIQCLIDPFKDRYMKQENVLGYCPINKKEWIKKEIAITPTHIIEQLNLRQQIASNGGIDKLNPKIALLSDEGIIEGVTEYFYRIVQDNRVTILCYHDALIMDVRLAVSKVFLLTETNKLITIFEPRSKMILLPEELYRIDHYFYIV